MKFSQRERFFMYTLINNYELFRIEKIFPLFIFEAKYFNLILCRAIQLHNDKKGAVSLLQSVSNLQWSLICSHFQLF